MTLYGFVSLIDTFVFVLIFLRIRIKCPECQKIQTCYSYKQCGFVLFFSVIIFIFYDILNGKIDVSWIDLMFGVMAIQLLRSWPAFFCRHCFKKIPLKEECILSKPFFLLIPKGPSFRCGVFCFVSYY